MITRLLGMEKLATKFFKMHNVDKKHFDNVWKSSILKPFWLNFMEVISLNSILVTTWSDFFFNKVRCSLRVSPIPLCVETSP